MTDAPNVISFSWQEAGQPEAARRFIAADAPELLALRDAVVPLRQFADVYSGAKLDGIKRKLDAALAAFDAMMEGR